MQSEDVWTATVVKKKRALFDGANLYRQVTVALEDGRTKTIRVERRLWTELEIGDHLVKEAGRDPRRG